MDHKDLYLIGASYKEASYKPEEKFGNGINGWANLNLLERHTVPSIGIA